jgi:hypothetical protein
VRTRPGRTTGEYIIELSENVPRASTSFTNASRLFERVWYGNADPATSDVQQFRSYSDEVRGAVKS